MNINLLESKGELIQDNSGTHRHYHTPTGKFISITALLNYKPNPSIEKWRKKVGEKKANAISKKATEHGTAIHDSVEKYILGNSNYKDNLSVDQISLMDELIPQLDSNIDNVLGIEMKLWSNQLKIAGTADLIAYHNGILSIIDWKTSKNIKPERYIKNYILQGTFYARAFYEMYGMIPEKIVIGFFITFENADLNPLNNSKFMVEWKTFSPLNYIRELKELSDEYYNQL